MLQLILCVILTFMSFSIYGQDTFESTANLPTAWKGRIRPLLSTAEEWSNESTQNNTLDHQKPLDALWYHHLSQHHTDPINTTTVNAMRERGLNAQQIELLLNSEIPLVNRLRNTGTTLQMLPLKINPTEWISLHALTLNIFDPDIEELVPIDNFTPFSNAHFDAVRSTYLNLVDAYRSKNAGNAAEAFSDAYNTAYAELSGNTITQAYQKSLDYPSFRQLRSESFYIQSPLLGLTVVCYLIALLLFSLTKLTRIAWIFTFSGFFIHTLLLALRCYILKRPPVSNMFESVVYVPWILMLIGLGSTWLVQSRVPVKLSLLGSALLLLLLKLMKIDPGMENVQAVLDSQYWLIVHVLMVVGSYGAFALSGLLGHFYLIKKMINKTSNLILVNKAILYTMYLGVGLLIPGTILGGVWAAESWGRFWDWDPKESWAFITACIYLIVIHCYTFKRIGEVGLAIGSIAGLLAVSFTWYGVNYILGTGLHTYGFGKGSVLGYSVYFFLECFFLSLVIPSMLKKNRESGIRDAKS